MLAEAIRSGSYPSIPKLARKAEVNERDIYQAPIEYNRQRRAIEQRDDGSVYVQFTTPQIPEVFRWVLGQGHTVKALGPAELVEMMKAVVNKVRGMYAV
jgi:predicted DNA-binding transcriptional regulator YafY